MDLRVFEVDRLRAVTLREKVNPLMYLLDGELFEKRRFDQAVKLGEVENREIRPPNGDAKVSHLRRSPPGGGRDW